MSRRSNPDRCAACRMHETLCVCALVPRLETRTRLALFVHYREARKPTNTGQLAARCLARSSVSIVGDRERPPTGLALRDGEVPVILAPDADAVPLADFVAGGPVVLVVPDGTWRQASKMRHRIPELVGLPCATLPELGPTAYQLRAEPREGGLATFEAIARALGLLEGDAGPTIEATMTLLFRTMVERTLWLRGALRDADVTGGIPAAARARDPRGAG